MRRVLVVATVLATLMLPAPPASAAPDLATTVIQDGLNHPWDVAFAPDGKMLVTERPGRILVFGHYGKDARLLRTHRIDNIRAESESGAMGIAVKRQNDKTLVFVCASRQVSAGWRNQVLRYRLFRDGSMRFHRVILGGMRANAYHNGCAVQVGPDNNLWVSMGDAGDLSLPQRRSSLNGKILRINYDGSIPGDNPFSDSPVYALGLRNPQGIAFEPGTKRPYSIEHGPDVHDEINRLRPGRNYGWPCWSGRSYPGPINGSSVCRSASSYSTPAWSSGGSTIATSGGVFLNGPRWGTWRNDLFVSTLKEEDVRRFELSDTGGRAYHRSTLFDGRWGRLRAAARAPGGNSLYLTTSNFDGSTNRVIRVTAR